MPRRIIPQSEADEAPNKGPAVAAAVTAGALRVAQRKVSRVLHAAVLSHNRIRASKLIQGMFRRGSNRRATDALVLTSNHAAPTNKPCVIPLTIVATPTYMDVELQYVATRAKIPLIAAASARSHVAMRTNVNRKAPSTLPTASSLADHITNLSQLVWGFFQLRAMQMMAMLALYEHEQTAVFDRTGESKSHIVCLLGT